MFVVEKPSVPKIVSSFVAARILRALARVDELMEMDDKEEPPYRAETRGRASDE